MIREVELVREHLGKETATRKEIVEAANELGIKHGTVLRKSEKIGHGIYRLESVAAVNKPTGEKVVKFRQPKPEPEITKGHTPEKDPCFVPFGDFPIVDTVVASERFMPLVITGDSGNGKTKMV